LEFGRLETSHPISGISLPGKMQHSDISSVHMYSIPPLLLDNCGAVSNNRSSWGKIRAHLMPVLSSKNTENDIGR
jgi:hypothetical protein